MGLDWLVGLVGTDVTWPGSDWLGGKGSCWADTGGGREREREGWEGSAPANAEQSEIARGRSSGCFAAGFVTVL